MNPFDESYFGLPGWLLVLVIWLIGFSGFGYQVFIAFRLIKLGGPDNRFNNWGLRAKEFLRGWLGQSKVLRDPVIGPLHAMIFWGFLCLSTDMFDLSSGGRFEKLLAFIHPLIANFWNLTVDMGYLIAGAGAFGALIRRVVIRPAKLKPSLEANLILVTILTIVITSFIVEAGEKPSNWEPIGVLFAGITDGLSTNTFEGLVVGSYWLHMILLSGFLIAIPASKHMHLVTALPNVIFHDEKEMARMRPMQVGDDGKAVLLDDLDIESFGISKYTDLSWRQLIDGWACTTCARCQDVCPAYESGKGLNPMQIIHDVRNYGNEHKADLFAGNEIEENLIARFTPDAIWACTTCHACVDVCPVYIEHVPKLTDARRYLMMEAMEYPSELDTAISNLEVNSNPYGFGPHERGDWASDLDVKVGEPAEYVYFVGCAASFDEKNKKVARSTIQLLNEAGVDVSILGMEEGCSGDPARRAGNEYLFQMLAETNMATFQELGVKKIIASCPHCFHTLGKEYQDYGGEDLEVIHHTEILSQLREEGKLEIEEFDEKVAFHDPCYLGRIGGVLDEPRKALGGDVLELERSGQNSFCCGAGGAQMWMEEDADQRVNVIRAKEAIDTGADTLAVGCPFCSVMMEDGLKSLGSEMEVKDVAELMWEQMKKNMEATKAET